MVKRLYLSLWLGSFIWSVTGSAVAAELTLKKIQQLALESSAELMQLRMEQTATEAEISAADAEHLPSINLNYSLNFTDNALSAFADKLNLGTVTATDFDPAILNDPSQSEIHITTLSAAVPVYAGGSINAAVRAAESVNRSISSGKDRLEQAIIYQAQVTYWQLQAAKRSLAITSDARKKAEQILKTNKRLYKQGRAIESDVLTTEVNLAAYKTAEVEAQTQLQLARNALSKIIGLNDEEMDSMGVVDMPLIRQDKTSALIELDELLEKAMQMRHDLKASESAAKASDEKENIVRGALKPQINFVASQQWFDDDYGFGSDSWRLALELNMDLDLSGKSNDRVQAVASRAQKYRYAVIDKKKAIIKEVSDAYRKVIEARERMAIASKNTEKARKASDLIEERYGQGRTILIDLLQSERSLMDARMSELKAQLTNKTSLLELRFATGDITISNTGDRL